MFLLETTQVMPGAIRMNGISETQDDQDLLIEKITKNFLVMSPPKCFQLETRVTTLIKKAQNGSLKASEDDADAQDVDSELKLEKTHEPAEQETTQETTQEPAEPETPQEPEAQQKTTSNQDSEEENYSDEEVRIRHDYYESEDDILFEGSESQEEEEETTPIETPEWYSFEDAEQLKMIFDLYSDALKLKEERKKAIREPPKFIGRIERCKVYSDSPLFQTFDIVDVYRRAILPPGSPMPHVKTFYFLTSWHQEEGLPIQLVSLTNSQRKFWQNKVEASAASSYLYCEPVFGNSLDFDYFVTEEYRQVRHSPRSYAHHVYDDFIPSFPPKRLKLVMSPSNCSLFEDLDS